MPQDKPKMGRPTNNPRTIQTRIRMNKHEKEMLEQCAARLGKTQTEVVIEGIQKVWKETEKE